MKKTVIAFALVTAISGCASHSGKQVRPTQLGGFQKGVTTEAEVIRALGAPNTSTMNSDGEKTITYAFAQYKIRGSTFIPIVGLFTGGSDVKTNSTIFMFDKDGKMLSYNVSETKISSGVGQR
jgi:outer membrane protein assembly factor BamE (lipoprotein component of BamABCDE complex)